MSPRRARGTHSSSSTRIGYQVGFRLLQRRDGNLGCDGREILEKRDQRVTAFDVVDQRLHGNARADEHRRAAQDIRIGVNDGRLFHWHCLLALLIPAERAIAAKFKPRKWWA